MKRFDYTSYNTLWAKGVKCEGVGLYFKLGLIYMPYENITIMIMAYYFACFCIVVMTFLTYL